MPVDYEYSYLDYYRHDAIASFSERLSPQLSNGHLENKEVDDAEAEWGLSFLLLRLIQTGVLKENPRSKEELESIWESFYIEYPDIEFTLEDIITNGWVRIVWGTWFIPREFVYSSVRKSDSEDRLFLFLKKLSESPYPSERKYYTPTLQDELDTHRKRYPKLPEHEWFIENELIFEEEGSFILNHQSPFFQHVASFLLAKLWEEKIVGPNNIDERLTWWIGYFDYFNSGWRFINFLTRQSKENFLEAGVNRLLAEKDCIGWDEERSKFLAELNAANPAYISLTPSISHAPIWESERELDRMNWFTSIKKIEAGIFLDEPRRLLTMLFSCLLNHDTSNSTRLEKIIDESNTRPYFYKLLASGDENLRALPILLLREDTLLRGMHGLIHYCASYQSGLNERQRQLEKSQKREVWEEGLTFFIYTLHKMSEEKAASVIVDLAEWFIHEIRIPIIGTSHRHRQRAKQLQSVLQVLLKMSYPSNKTDSYMGRLFPTLLQEVEQRLSSSECPMKEATWPFMMWLVEQWSVEQIKDYNHIIPSFAKKIGDYYKKSYESDSSFHRWIGIVECEIESAAWKPLAELIYESSRKRRQDFLYPIDFQELPRLDKGADAKEREKYVGKIRVHMRLLTYLSMNVENSEMLQSVNQALEGLLIDIQEIKEIDIFDSLYEETILGSKLERKVYLFRLVSKAINRFEDSLRASMIKHLLASTMDMRRLSVLHNAMSRENDKKSIMEAIKKKTVEASVKHIYTFTDIQHMVTEMLNTEDKEIAAMANEMMDRNTKTAHERGLSYWIEWEFRERIRSHYILGNYDKILNTTIPTKLKNQDYTRRALNYFKGLVLLNSQKVEDKEMAVKLFQQLRQYNANHIGYGINLVAANIRLLESYVSEYGTNSQQVQQLVAYLTSLLTDVHKIVYQASNQYAIELLTENHLFMFILTENWTGFWYEYQSLSIELKHQLKIGGYAVQTHIKQGDWEEAERLLGKLMARHGPVEQLEVLGEEIREKRRNTSFQIPPLLTDSLDWKSVGATGTLLKGLPPYEQAKAYFNHEEARVRDVLIKEVLQACEKITKIAPTLLKYKLEGDKLIATQGQEDHYNDVLAVLLDQSIKSLAWSTSTQDRGGFTGSIQSIAGGIGERDIIIKDNNNREITIIEALRLQHLETKNILKHFYKIFGYDATDTDFYFLITWGFSDDPTELWEKYRNVVLTWQEGGYSVQEEGKLRELFPHLDQQWPRSFYTKHIADDQREIYAIHLYVDVKMTSKQVVAQK